MMLKRNYLTFFVAAALAGAMFSSASGTYVVFGDDLPERENRAVHPITAPYFHEDAFIQSDIRAWFINHSFYGDTIGGEVQVYAVQVRLALTEKLQLVAYKDGYTDISDSALGSPSGMNDIAAGIKYAIVQDWENNFHLSAGVGYEIGLGDDDVLQDNDELRFWLSANRGFEKLNLGAVLNYRFALDEDEGLGDSDMVSIHLHADYYVAEWFSPVVEINAYYVMKEGEPGLPFSGVDAVAVGGGENEDTITGAIGAEFRPAGPNLGLRLAYETELTDSISLFGHRWTFSGVWEF